MKSGINAQNCCKLVNINLDIHVIDLVQKSYIYNNTTGQFLGCRNLPHK
jgi:hypothetical protein